MQVVIGFVLTEEFAHDLLGTLSNTSEQETLPFSAGTLASQQRSQQVLEDFEARKRAKQLVSDLIVIINANYD